MAGHPSDHVIVNFSWEIEGGNVRVSTTNIPRCSLTNLHCHLLQIISLRIESLIVSFCRDSAGDVMKSDSSMSEVTKVAD
jgi:hypothetical protein